MVERGGVAWYSPPPQKKNNIKVWRKKMLKENEKIAYKRGKTP